MNERKVREAAERLAIRLRDLILCKEIAPKTLEFFGNDVVDLLKAAAEPSPQICGVCEKELPIGEYCWRSLDTYFCNDCIQKRDHD